MGWGIAKLGMTYSLTAALLSHLPSSRVTGVVPFSTTFLPFPPTSHHPYNTQIPSLPIPPSTAAAATPTAATAAAASVAATVGAGGDAGAGVSAAATGGGLEGMPRSVQHATGAADEGCSRKTATT
ncbi:hypothetical protein CLOM_g11880 [Closterium sp. NIES-68]|nr:hypothetical protein CLOM_g11880 [Closterium sp. NIES-68]